MPDNLLLLIIFLGLVALVWLVARLDRNFRAQEREREAAETKRKRDDLRRLEQERTKRERQEQQEQNGRELLRLGDQALDTFESLPTLLQGSEDYADQAQRDFTDGAFSPFWDSIEEAARRLANYNETIGQLHTTAGRYVELAGDTNAPPEFPLGVDSIRSAKAADGTAVRLKALVRRAQRDPDFAKIYELRKTNQILIAGFRNLSQLLNDIEARITASIEDVASSLTSLTTAVEQSGRAIRAGANQIAESNDQARQEFSRDAAHRAARERQVLSMFDNIQRGRKPLF